MKKDAIKNIEEEISRARDKAKYLEKLSQMMVFSKALDEYGHHGFTFLWNKLTRKLSCRSWSMIELYELEIRDEELARDISKAVKKATKKWKNKIESV